jgi:hypothetical protein
MPVEGQTEGTTVAKTGRMKPREVSRPEPRNGIRASGALVLALAVVTPCIAACEALAPCVTGSRTDQVCSMQASAVVSAPSGATLEPPLEIGGGCDGGCTHGFELSITQASSDFACEFTLAAPVAELTPLTLDNPAGVVACTAASGSRSRLALLAGSLSIDDVDDTSFHVSFSLVLGRGDGTTIRISDGHAQITDCHEVETCTY